ncbi:uncharacterized protein LOC144747474 [Ciona intestinalis]
MERDELTITCWLFTLKCTGKAVEQAFNVAQRALNTVMMSTLGMIGVSASLVWRTQDPDRFLQAVTRGILGTVDNAFVQSFQPGSLTVKVVAKDKKAAHALMELYTQKKIIQNLNKAIKEYADKYHHGLGEFESVYLTNYNQRIVTNKEIHKIEQNASSSLNFNNKSKGLPIWIDPSEIKTGINGAKLGSGSFGKVLRCYYKPIGRCAVKCMMAAKDSSTTKKIFENEAGMLLMADNPHIVWVYGITSWVGSLGIVMEYMERGNLSELVKNARAEEFQIPFNLLVRILLQVANGVAFLHKIGKAQQIVHGDLKPSNIVLDNNFTAKVTDFGGATLRTYTGTDDSSFSTNLMKGCSEDLSADEKVGNQLTIIYTAPERLQSVNHKATKQSDVYSFGMTIYECLSDLVPFTGMVGPFHQIIVVDKSKPQCEGIKLKQQVHSGNLLESLLFLEQWMEKCWKYNPEDRPKMTDIRNKLQDHFDVVALGRIWESIAEVSSRIKLSVLAPAKQEISLNRLCPPDFDPSKVIAERPTTNRRAIKPTTAVSFEPTDKILQLTRSFHTALTSPIENAELKSAVDLLVRDLKKVGELSSDNSIRLVCELHILCQKMSNSIARRELADFGAKTCLNIQNRSVQESFHDSFLKTLSYTELPSPTC